MTKTERHPMRDKYNIFLSYSHSDVGIAKHLALQLESAGLRCFMAETGITAGELWEEKIRKAIRGADRVLILITPRSRNSLWVAAEAGAAWALKKDLTAAMMFVEPAELIEPIRRHQGRSIETPEQVAALINELASTRQFATDKIDEQWIDPSDNDTIFFKQKRDRVVGFYDFGSGKQKVGVYFGRLKNRVFNYEWRWLNGQFHGYGQLNLSEDGKTLSGEWWYDKRKDESEFLEFRRASESMPSWLSSNDFAQFSDQLK